MIRRSKSVLRPLFMGAESCEKSKSFLATFGPKLWSKTIFVHARYGAMGHESFVHGSGGMRRRVWFKIQKLRSPPREAKKSNTQPLSRTLNLARCTQRKAPSSSHQPVWHSIWRYPTKRLRCQSNPGGWGVCCLWEILCNRGLVRCFWLLRKCADISAGCWIRHAYVRRVLT